MIFHYLQKIKRFHSNTTSESSTQNNDKIQPKVNKPDINYETDTPSVNSEESIVVREFGGIL